MFFTIILLILIFGNKLSLDSNHGTFSATCTMFSFMGMEALIEFLIVAIHI